MTMNGALGHGWNLALWIAQGFLCVMFLFGGVMKLAKSPEGLAKMGWLWAQSIPRRFILFIGIMEIAGSVGIVVPPLVGILPVLVPLSALGFILVQVSAIVLHARRKETAQTLWLNSILLAAALFVLWGRL
ncbi:MAG: DoxX family protein [Pseudomonadota bacterium]|nr:DoxX family protein [Pseudomonadota bacterium]